MEKKFNEAIELARDNEELIELLETMRGEHVDIVDDLNDEIKTAKEERDEFATELENLQNATPEFETVQLNRDVFYYSLEKGNLDIQFELEKFIERLKEKY